MKKNNMLKTIFSYAGETKGNMILSVFFAIISAFAGLVPYLCAYKIIEMFFAGTPLVGEILYWCGVALLGQAVRVAGYLISTTLSHISAYNILKNMRMRIANRLMKAPLGTVLNQTAGKMKSVIVDQVENIEIPLAHLIPEGISYALVPLCTLIYLFSVNWVMAIAALATIPVAGVVYAKVMTTFNHQYAQYMAANEHVNGIIVEYVEGIEVIKAFNQSATSYTKYSSAIKSFKEYTLAWYQSSWKLLNLGGAILPSTLAATVPVGMYLYYKGGITPAELTICLILSLGIVGPLTAFSAFVNMLKSIEFSVNSAEEFMNLEELPNKNTPVKFENYDIKLSGVTFAYPGAKGEKDSDLVLKGIDLEIKEGSFTALVGPSGGGKSTVARLIARFWDVSGGSIKIGGADIKDIPLEQLADNVSFVTQDNFLFNCSLMENIRLGNPAASDEQVFEAAKAACCHEFISALPNGYATDAGEAGARLSGGERQRISIARVILKNAKIIILDEATAFTDPENEEKIQKSIAALTKGKTLFVIAHRLSTIKNADNIVVIENGTVNVSGTHAQLLESSPLYKTMWDSHINAKKWAASSEQTVLATEGV